MEKLKVNPRDLRLAHGLSQTQFWGKVDLTQSAGSRYENGERRLPPSLDHVLRIVYVEHIELKDITGDNIGVSKMLMKDNPDLYASLLTKVKSMKKYG